MTQTTIKVDAVIRDRIAAVARARGLTMGALLEVESLRLEREVKWQQVEADCARLQHEDPDGWAEYLRELDEVCATEVDAEPGAEWPEYNG